MDYKEYYSISAADVLFQWFSYQWDKFNVLDYEMLVTTLFLQIFKECPTAGGKVLDDNFSM
jgi:hypothetical protein